MAKWNEYGLKTGTSARDEVLILDSDTNTNKRITVGDIQEFANGKMLEKENSTLNTEAKTLIGAINEVDAKNNAQDESLEAIGKKFSSYVKKTDVDSMLTAAGSPADAKVVGERFKSNEKAISELADKKITKFYASSQGNTHLPDSDKGKIQDMFLYGKSEQAQYAGYNKLTLLDAQQINDGVECKIVGSKLQFKGTATSTYSTFDAKGVVISAGKKITAYTNSKHGFFVWLRDSENKLYTFNEGVKTAVYDKDVTLKQFGIRGYQSGESINELVDFGLMVGSDVYEPYVGGIPSPNPEFPQEVKAVVNPVVKVRGKNLLNPILGTETKNGVTCTANGDGTYTLNGTATKDTLFPVNSIGAESNKIYRLVGCPSGGSNATYNMLMQDIVNWSTAFDNGSGVNKSYSESYTIRVSIQIKSGVTVNNLVFKPMVTTDLNATYDDYEPYTEQSVTLPYTLNAIPVKTGGNVTIGNQQYVADYVDVERGKLVRMVDFSKLDNTQSIVDKTEWLLEAPQEIDLTTEQTHALKELTTYYPVTNISINSEQLYGYTTFNYPISMADGWNYVKQQLKDNRDYIYDMDLQSAEAYVNSEYAVALTELEVM